MARPFQFDKEAALNNAMLLFWENGYCNTSYDQIVDRLGLSRSSIYNSFSDKKNLFIESLKFYIQKESKSLVSALNDLPPNQESIKTILQQIVYSSISQKHPKGCMVVNTAIEFAHHDKVIRQIVEANAKEVISAFTDFIEAGQLQSSINNHLQAEALAVALFHQITALRVTGKIMRDKSFFETAINTFSQLFAKS